MPSSASHCVGVVQDAERISGAAEIGVVMLLFVIGLELSPARLKVMRHSLGLTDAADRIEAAVTAALVAGHRTPDLGGTATTQDMTNAVLAAL